MDPITALIGAFAALLGGCAAYIRLRREPDLNEARLQRNVDQLEDMLETYEKDRARFLQELERERGKVEQLELEIQQEHERAKSIIEEKQRQLDLSLRKIAILEHQKQEAEEEIRTLRRALSKHIHPPPQDDVA